MSKLTEKQKAFADYYIESLNATQSAIDAGYSKNTASEMGYENLNKPHIKDYINERLREASNGRIATIQEIMEFHTKVMNNNYRDLGYEKPLWIKDRQVSAEALTKRLELIEAKGEDKDNSITVKVVRASDKQCQK